MSADPPRKWDQKWDWGFGLIAWLDVETTGLYRPGKPLPALLETALLITTPDLECVTWASSVIKREPEDFVEIHPVAEAMHKKNGLIEECLGPLAVPVRTAELIMTTALDEAQRLHPELGDRPVVWAGWSPSALDRPMIGHHMPEFYKRLHYRTWDLSAFKLGMINFTSLTFPEKDEIHRAHADNLEAVAEARRIAEFLQSCPIPSLASA